MTNTTTPQLTQPSLDNIEIWVTATVGLSFLHFLYYPTDLAHQAGQLERVPGPAPISLPRLRNNLREDGIHLDLDAATFKTIGDNTSILTEIGLENYLEVEHHRGKRQVHWILQTNTGAEGRNNPPETPKVPDFDNAESCTPTNIRLVVFPPGDECVVQYFERNLFKSVNEKVLSYSRLVANLREELPTVDLSNMQLMDRKRNMPICSQRALINHYRAARVRGTATLEWHLSPMSCQQNVDVSIPTRHIEVSGGASPANIPPVPISEFPTAPTTQPCTPTSLPSDPHLHSNTHNREKQISASTRVGTKPGPLTSPQSSSRRSPGYTTVGIGLKMGESSGMWSVQNYGASSGIRPRHRGARSSVSRRAGSLASSRAGSHPGSPPRSGTAYSGGTTPTVASTRQPRFSSQGIRTVGLSSAQSNAMTKTRERNIITPRRSDRISKRSSDKRSCFKEAISISSDSSDDDCVVAGYGGSPKYISPDSPGDDDSPVGSSEDDDGDWGASEGEELEPELVGEGDWGKESEEDDEDEDIRRPVKRARLSQQVSGCGKSPFHRQSRSNMSGSGTAEQVESHSDARIGTPAEQPYLVGEVTESLELTVSRANLGLDMEDGTDGNKSLSAEDRIRLAQEQAAVAHWNEMEWCDIICPVMRHNPNLTTPTELVKVAGIKLPLFVHQVSCVWWCLKQQQTAWRAGMIGDEMGFGKSAQIATFIELNAQLVQLHHDLGHGDHLAHGDTGAPCPTSPVSINAAGFPNHLPCPCENPHTRRLTGTAGPTMIACPPSLIPNLRNELVKFANLDVQIIYDKQKGPDWADLHQPTAETLRGLSRTVILMSPYTVERALQRDRLSKSVKYDSHNPIHTGIANNLTLMEQLGFTVGMQNRTDSPVVWKARQGRSKRLHKIRILHVPFARIIMDEGHKIRSSESHCLGWLKYIDAPVWIVSGSSGWMPPQRWTGWLKVWQQEGWSNDREMRRFTFQGFKSIQKAFTEAAKVFDPATGIQPTMEEIDSDGYDEIPRAARERRQKLDKGLNDWASFLQHVMIRRTQKDTIWGSPLLTIPKGVSIRVCVKFCDVDGAVRRDYQTLTSEASQRMLEQWHELFQGTRGATRDLMVNIYRRCRIASSVPALCSIAAFKNGNWDRANVASYRTAGTRAQSPYSGHLDTIIRLSPKLLWLRDFIANQLGSSPEAPDEKLLIFSFSPVVLHCVDLCLDKWNISVGSAWAAPPDTRALMFEEFQKADNPRVLTGTYGTMGEGATLIRAFRCILLDPDWEISKENQAIGRIHRCGQRNPTTSIRVYCQESFDEKIIAHQNTGRELNEHALGLTAMGDASDPAELEAVLNRFATQHGPMPGGGSLQ